jgi:hypothetical protein
MFCACSSDLHACLPGIMLNTFIQTDPYVHCITLLAACFAKEFDQEQ